MFTYNPIKYLKFTDNIENYIHKPLNCMSPDLKLQALNSTTPHGIPKISHHLWISGVKEKEVPSAAIKVLKDNFERMDNKNTASPKPWKHIFWSNNLEKIKDITNALNNFTIEYRDINDPKHHLQHLKIINNLLKMDTVRDAVGAAVDILKYDIVNQHGGMVMDLNYLLITNPDHYFKNNDMILQRNRKDFLCLERVENFMVAAKAEHPVLVNFLHYLDKIVDYYSNSKEVIFLTDVTYGCLFYFYKKYSQTEGNCDLTVSHTQQEVCSANFKRSIREAKDCIKEDIESYLPIIPSLTNEAKENLYQTQFLAITNLYSPNYFGDSCTIDPVFGIDNREVGGGSWI